MNGEHRDTLIALTRHSDAQLALDAMQRLRDEPGL